jgi:methylthioribose-1-phosphate isomerase
LAVAARHHGVKFMVVAPTSTIDWRTETGEGIKVEERDQNELLNEYFARPGSVIKAWNPVFDVTPAELIDCIVTERGIVRNPDRQAMKALAGAI